VKIANAESFANWNGESGVRWSAEADRRDLVLAPIGDALLDAVKVSPGEHALDVGCGCGATTLAAARATPTGSVVGLDLSEPMLAVARTRAASQGLDNVSFEQGDAQTFESPIPFDAVVSRFGTMFFDNPIAAFANVAHRMRLGGRLCLATWQPLAANEWLMIPGAALLRFGSLPESDPGGPGMFSQSEPEAVTTVLNNAGFDAIQLESATVRLTLGTDPDDATEYLAGSGIGRAVLETVPDADKQPAIDAVRAVLVEHADADGVHLNAAVWIVRATKPPA
jgi:SAM-dependent methyltransferase